MAKKKTQRKGKYKQGEKEPDYSIVDWIINPEHVNYGNVLGNEADLLAATQRVGNKRLNTYMKHEHAFTGVSKKSGKSLKGEIDTNNENFTKETKEKIAAAKTNGELTAILSTMKGTTGYRQETYAALEKEIEAKIEKTGGGKENKEKVDNLIGLINKAKSQDALEKLPSISEIRKQYGKAEGDRYAKEMLDKSADIQKLELIKVQEEEKETLTAIFRDDTRKKIASATTTGQLDAINLAEAPTTAIEKQMERELNQKRAELERREEQ